MRYGTWRPRWAASMVSWCTAFSVMVGGAIGRQEDGPFRALADGQVDRPRGPRRERDGDDLPALAGDHQGAVPTLNPERLDVGVRSFGNP